ncbi:MAG: glycosyltransferase family 2 protein, partial [Taibaiella sp.]|nr:glycosyltransferase family 2 protein [Taibaiella sp.]
MSNYLSCTIVLPCYNPQPGWAARIVEQYSAIVERLGVEVEVILVNDGSTANISDSDINTLKQDIPAFRYISYAENRGKGYALRKGIAEAQSDIIIYTDVDFPYSVDSVVSIYGTLHYGQCDAAPGIKDEHYYAKVPPVRRYISQILRGLISMFFRIPVTDTQCGLKGFKKSVQPVFLSTTIDRYLFDLEFIRLLYRKGYSVKPVKVSLNNDV